MIRQAAASSSTGMAGADPSIALHHDEVHVWLADLNQSGSPHEIDRILSEEERSAPRGFTFRGTATISLLVERC